MPQVLMGLSGVTGVKTNMAEFSVECWEFCSLKYRLRKGGEKSYYNTGYSYLVIHPGMNPTDK